MIDVIRSASILYTHLIFLIKRQSRKYLSPKVLIHPKTKQNTKLCVDDESTQTYVTKTYVTKTYVAKIATIRGKQNKKDENDAGQ